jgi:ectoine hydroxylase-related dioxygenase (phytanoyl-CoA dioxygenase family)
MEKSYGVAIQNSVNSSFEMACEEISILGYTIINDVLSEKELEVIRAKLDDAYEIQKNQFGEKNLTQINEEYLVRCPLLHDSVFLQLAINKKVLEFVEFILGNYFILNLQNGIINMPKEFHHQSSWHKDLPYQNFVISNPLAISALFCIDDFNDQTGGTFILPYSHKIEASPSSHFVNKHKIQVNAPAGSVILFDSMLLHKAGYNQSDKIRRGINNIYSTPILKQQINLPSSLNGKYSDDAFLSKFLGYQSDAPLSVQDFRNKRLNKNK